MNADKIRELVADGRTVVVMLTNATVVSVKSDFIRLRSGHITGVKKFVVKDEILGTIWFSTSSNKLWNMVEGDKITSKVTLTGMGKPTPRYPDPIMFAKINARQRELKIDSIVEHNTSFVDGVAIPHDTTENSVNPL